MSDRRTLIREAGVRARGSSKLDALGAVLFAACVGVTYIAAAVRGGNADDVAALFAVCGLAFVIARSVGITNRVFVPAVIVVAAGVIAVGSADDLLSRAPLSGPFGYANAKGSFFAQAAIAALMVAAASTSVQSRIAGASAAIAFAAVPFVGGTAAAAFPLVVLVLLAALGGHTRRTARWVVTIMGLLLGVTLLVTMVLGATYSRGREDAVDLVVDRSLSERRVILWHEALTMMSHDPLTGVGPSRFQFVSPTAREDRDSRWAHNEFLQFGAETGVGGFVVLVALFAWGFVRLHLRHARDALTVLGGAALAALGIHSCVDYVLHFPAIPIVASALVGTAMASSRTLHQPS